MSGKIATFGAMLALVFSAGFAGAAPALPQTANCCAAQTRCCEAAQFCCDRPEQAACCQAGTACCDLKDCCGTGAQTATVQKATALKTASPKAGCATSSACTMTARTKAAPVDLSANCEFTGKLRSQCCVSQAAAMPPCCYPKAGARDGATAGKIVH